MKEEGGMVSVRGIEEKLLEDPGTHCANTPPLSCLLEEGSMEAAAPGASTCQERRVQSRAGSRRSCGRRWGHQGKVSGEVRAGWAWVAERDLP